VLLQLVVKTWPRDLRTRRKNCRTPFEKKKNEDMGGLGKRESGEGGTEEEIKEMV
jgi:hypothetical protein